MNKVYLVGVRGTCDAVAISLSLETAQEILMAYAYEDGHYIYNLYRSHGYKHEHAMAEALDAMDSWYIWGKGLI